MLMRMIWDGYLHRTASMGGPGIEEVKWLKPIRPGDVLSAKATCLESRPSQSRSEMGIIKTHYEVANQHGEAVMTWVGFQFVARRPAAARAVAAEAEA
jgi:acyl dehydratase